MIFEVLKRSKVNLVLQTTPSGFFGGGGGEFIAQ